MQDGRTRRLKANSFDELVAKLKPKKVPITRDAFHQLSKKERLEYKDGKWLSPCSYPARTRKRKKESAHKISLLCMDFDQVLDGEPYEDYATQIYEHDDLSTALWPFSFVAYETASSLPTRRAIRIVVDCEALDLDDYGPAVTELASTLGIEMDKWKGASESMKYSQPMFFPLLFEDDDDEFSPLFAYSALREPFSALDLPRDNVPESSRKDQSPSANDSPGSDSPPAPDQRGRFPIEIAEDALSALGRKADRLDYEPWLYIFSGLCNSYGRAGMELMQRHVPEDFEGEYEKKFRNRTRKHTVGTLFYHAKKDAGWTFPTTSDVATRAEIVVARLIEAEDEEWYYHKKDGKFLHRNARGWFAETKQGAIDSLRASGISTTAPPDGPLSDAAAFLHTVKQTRDIDWHGELAGYRAGFYEFGSTRALVTTSPQLPEPEEGDFALIRSILDRMLGSEQLLYFYSWFKNVLVMLYEELDTQVQAVALVGPPGCGKTFLQDYILTPCTGGSTANPGLFIRGSTDFNADLIRAIHLAISDLDGELSKSRRSRSGTHIKQFVANTLQDCHPKGIDKIALPTRQYLTISLNETPLDVAVLPPMKDGVRDKLHLLSCLPGEMPMPTRTPQEKKAFRDAIQAEIPAFVHFVLNEWEIPEDLRDERYGVKTYHAPEVMRHLDDLEGTGDVADFVKWGLFRNNDRKDITAGVSMLYAEIQLGLRPHELRVFTGIVRSGLSLGSRLGLLAKSPLGAAWIHNADTSQQRRWRISRPDDMPSPNDDDIDDDF